MYNLTDDEPTEKMYRLLRNQIIDAVWTGPTKAQTPQLERLLYLVYSILGLFIDFA